MGPLVVGPGSPCPRAPPEIPYLGSLALHLLVASYDRQVIPRAYSVPGPGRLQSYSLFFLPGGNPHGPSLAPPGERDGWCVGLVSLALGQLTTQGQCAMETPTALKPPGVDFSALIGAAGGHERTSPRRAWHRAHLWADDLALALRRATSFALRRGCHPALRRAPRLCVGAGGSWDSQPMPA
ncbi:PREDICTED: uncharacterized protein LOC105556887 [Vollenhovia emeryi]|uniref:uncharacterized protein LOC105556887 n=1 Tax=Vollenhovia emeryi TaxID=411798 RepID=UPI0005F4AC95|nr:PREDICTED: uncharacterized protein LOC105556887 [Vollenhovia emeryi]